MSTKSSLIVDSSRRKTPTSEPAALPSRTQNIYAGLLRSIIVGEIAQGEFLSEVKLAQRFETSRTPIREACIHLYKEGFLRVAPHKGYVVTEVSLEEIQELYHLRQILEPEAAALAAHREPNLDFLAQCRALLAKQQPLLRQERTYEAFLELGSLEYGFHHGIAKASGNKKLAKFVSEIMNQFRRFHFICFRKSPWLVAAFDEHSAILEAIGLRDSARARQLMYEHVTRGAERGVQLLLGAFSANIGSP